MIGRLLFNFCILLLTACPAIAQIAQTGEGRNPPQGPCDVLAAGGTPCVAAHSLARKMRAIYSGNAFQLQRASDSTTLEVGFNSDGTINYAPVTAFCSGTTCVYSIIYDQMHTPGSGNNLPKVSTGQPFEFYSTGTANSRYGRVVPFYIASAGNQPYRNRASTVGMPTGNSSTTEYYVRTNSISSSCCGDYGNMESSVVDNGAGHMFALAYSTLNATPAQVGIDREDGLLTEAGTVATTFNLIIKHTSGSNQSAIELGDATTGILTTLYNGADPVTFNLEGGLSLGEGGDGSAASDTFLEGAIIAAATSTATDNALQANVVSFYGPNIAAPSLGGMLDIAPSAVVCYSLRACSASYATGSNNAITIRRASDNTTSNIVILSNGLLDVATATTFCNGTTCFVTEFFDQSGNGHHLTQATNATQPQLNLSGGPASSLPYISCNGSQTLQVTSGIPTENQPYSYSVVAERTGALTSVSTIVSNYSSGNQPALQFDSTAGVILYAGQNSKPAPASNNAWHAVSVVGQGPISFAYVDGVTTTLLNSDPGSGSANGGHLGICRNPDGSQPLTGNVYEAAFWGSDVVSANAPALTAAQHAMGGGW